MLESHYFLSDLACLPEIIIAWLVSNSNKAGKIGDMSEEQHATAADAVAGPGTHGDATSQLQVLFQQNLELKTQIDQLAGLFNQQWQEVSEEKDRRASRLPTGPPFQVFREEL